LILHTNWDPRMGRLELTRLAVGEGKDYVAPRQAFSSDMERN